MDSENELKSFFAKFRLMSMLDPIKEIDGVVLDSAHGFWWRICIWETLLALIVLGGFISGGKHPDYFFEAFFSSMLLIVIQLFICILIPSIIRIASNKQHGKGMSFFVAIVSWLLMALYIVTLEKSLDIKVSGGGFISVLFPVAGYKIMRSVAGFSSVFWRIKKKSMAADNKFNESLGESIKEENRSQIIVNSDSLIREAVCLDVLNNDNKKNEFTETPDSRGVLMVTVWEKIKPILKIFGIVISLVVVGGIIYMSVTTHKKHIEEWNMMRNKECSNKIMEILKKRNVEYFAKAPTQKTSNSSEEFSYTVDGHKGRKFFRNADDSHPLEDKEKSEKMNYVADLRRDWTLDPEARKRVENKKGKAWVDWYEKMDEDDKALIGSMELMKSLYDGDKDNFGFARYMKENNMALIDATEKGIWNHFGGKVALADNGRVERLQALRKIEKNAPEIARKLLSGRTIGESIKGMDQDSVILFQESFGVCSKDEKELNQSIKEIISKYQ